MATEEDHRVALAQAAGLQLFMHLGARHRLHAHVQHKDAAQGLGGRVHRGQQLRPAGVGAHAQLVLAQQERQRTAHTVVIVTEKDRGFAVHANTLG